MIKQVAWSDEARKGLSKALPGGILLIVRSEVRAGISMLWHCKDDKHEAYCVTRLDGPPKEWVIVAFEGSGMMEFGKYFVEAARAKGIPLRAHVTNQVVERLLRKLGLQRSEAVLRTRAA